MAKKFKFEIDDRGALKKELAEYVRTRVIKVIPNMEAEMIEYINRVIIDKGINRRTEFVRWVLSKEGLGFLGWKKPFAEEQIFKMKEEIKRTTQTEVKKLKIKIYTSESDYLEAVLRVLKNRYSIEDKVRYQFLEEWYEWLTQGYVGDERFKVFYETGKGESNLASMDWAANEGTNTGSSRENAISKLNNPALEAFEMRKKDVIDNFRKILVKNVEKAFKN